MDERWHHMKSAPTDGTRVLVTLRQAEQGPAEVDVAYWAPADAFAGEGWRAADSHPGSVVGYADSELQCWMPMPTASQGSGTDASAMPAPWEGEDAEELYGSGI